MKEKRDKIDRRVFLKTVGAAGLGSVWAGCKGKAQQEPNSAEPAEPETTLAEKYPQVPRRKLGKTGLEIPILCLGGNQDLIANQIVLRKSPQWGVIYWDTAHNYRGGNSELGIGKYLAKNPQARKKLLIASKASGARTAADVEKRLQMSLKRMNTDYIDVYYGVHQCSRPEAFTDELRRWAQDAKKRRLIRFFGISTHQNMAEVISAAAKLDWIEVLMTIWNFRLMQDEKLNAAIDAFSKTGKGLIAIKTLGMGQKIRTEEDKKLVSHFLQRGFTAAQAKIKLVLEDKRFTAVCVGMQNLSLLTANVAVALDKTRLSGADKRLLVEYARATCSSYCAGCTNICKSALPDAPYVCDIMRYLMYYNSYGDRGQARGLFARIPRNVRSKLLNIDYSRAEALCPQHLPIRQLLTEAIDKLA